MVKEPIRLNEGEKIDSLSLLMINLRLGKELIKEESEYMAHLEELLERKMLTPMAKYLVNRISKEELFLVHVHHREFMDVFHETGLRATQVLAMVR